jgi:hypothetical protein
MYEVSPFRVVVAVSILTLGLAFAGCSDEEQGDELLESGGESGHGGEGGDSSSGKGGESAVGGGNGSEAGGGGADGEAGNTGTGDAGGAASAGAGPVLGSGGEGGSQENEVVLLNVTSFVESDWQFVDPAGATPAAPNDHGDWTVENGILYQTTNFFACDEINAPCDEDSREGTLAVRKDAVAGEWSDYTVSTSFWTYDDDAVGVIARYVDENNYLAFDLHASLDYVRIRAIRDGVWTVWKDEEPSVTYTQSSLSENYVVNRIALEVVGNRYRAFVGDTMVFEVTDEDEKAPAQGGVGVLTHGSVDVYFGSLRVVEE